jgi:hypothetical protein
MLTKLLGLGLIVAAAGCSSKAEGVAARQNSGKALICESKAPPPTSAKASGNPQARKAAQRGLGYLVKASKEWTQAHNCFGCHVQAVTMEALTVGMHHQYDVGMADVDFMAKALDLGVTAGGRVTGAAFQGSAWARYDMWINLPRPGDPRGPRRDLRHAGWRHRPRGSPSGPGHRREAARDRR